MDPISPCPACDLCSSSDVVNSSPYTFAPTLRPYTAYIYSLHAPHAMSMHIITRRKKIHDGCVWDETHYRMRQMWVFVVRSFWMWVFVVGSDVGLCSWVFVVQYGLFLMWVFVVGSDVVFVLGSLLYMLVSVA